MGVSAAYTGLHPPPVRRMREAKISHVFSSYAYDSHFIRAHGTI